MVRMIADPPVRRDGLCVQCGKPRRMPRPQRGIDASVYALDPYCSSLCARAWHNNPLPSHGPGYIAEKRGRHERVAA